MKIFQGSPLQPSWIERSEHCKKIFFFQFTFYMLKYSTYQNRIVDLLLQFLKQNKYLRVAHGDHFGRCRPYWNCAWPVLLFLWATSIDCLYQIWNMRVCSTSMWHAPIRWFMMTSWQVIILIMRRANERRRYIVTSSLIDWAHTQNNLGSGDMQSIERHRWILVIKRE